MTADSGGKLTPQASNALSSAMVPETAIRTVYVAGDAIVEDGVPLGLDLSELAARVRAAKAVLR